MKDYKVIVKSKFPIKKPDLIYIHKTDPMFIAIKNKETNRLILISNSQDSAWQDYRLGYTISKEFEEYFIPFNGTIEITQIL